MMKTKLLAVLMLCALLCGALTLGVGAEESEDTLTKVTDVDGLLGEFDEERINAALEMASEEMGIPICAYVFEYVGRTVEGEDYLAAKGLSVDDDLVLMVVTVRRNEINYNLYTFGDAAFKINEKEVNYILDDREVYDNIKTGEIADGLCAYASLAREAYCGRLGVSWVLILLGSLIIGAIASWICVKSIAQSYKRKNPSQSYPLDRFAKLELTKESERVIGKFVTTTIISSGGGRGGHGGGRSGGGAGHRGGR